MIQPVAERTPAGTSYLVTGQGQPVVLIHGVGLNKEMWGGQIVGLATDYKVIAYDMLGHGQSQLPAADTPLEGYAAQLAELLDHLQIAQATVIGFSMGGLVARAFALNYPQRLTALVVLNSVFNRSPEQSAGVIARAAQAAELGPDALRGEIPQAVEPGPVGDQGHPHPGQVRLPQQRVDLEFGRRAAVILRPHRLPAQDRQE